MQTSQNMVYWKDKRLELLLVNREVSQSLFDNSKEEDTQPSRNQSKPWESYSEGFQQVQCWSVPEKG